MADHRPPSPPGGPRLRPRAIVTPAGAVFRGSIAHDKARTLLSVLAIALGVALGYAVQLINQAAINELAQGVQTLSGDADLDVRGPRGGFDEAIYPVLARLPEVAVASPVLEVDAKVPDRIDALHIVGLDPFRAAYLQPGLIPTADEPFALLRADTLFLTPTAAHWLGKAKGEHIRLQAGLADVDLVVGGLLTAASQQRFAVMDIAAVQERFDRLRRLTRVDLRLRPGVDVDAFRDRLRAQLPPGLQVDRPEATVKAAASLSRSYRVNLNVLALVALFTGGLLVFSTQALSVVRRRAPFALLRVLGMTRRRLLALVVIESALMGVIGSAAGLLAGFALARLALDVLGGDLGSGYFRGLAPSLTPEPWSSAIFLLLGIVIAVMGGLVPALEAANAPPARALKAGDEERPFERLRPAVPGLAVLVVGALATTLPPAFGLPLFGYAAIALFLIGTLMLMPRIAIALLAVLPAPRRAALQLALAQLRGAPGQMTVSLATIVASVGLMVSMAIMVSSFRHSLTNWLTHLLPADAYFRVAASGDTAYVGPEAQARIAALAGVRRVEFSREQQVLLDPAQPRLVLVARPLDPAHVETRLPLEGEALRVAPGAPPPVWVNGAAADVYGFVPGKVIELPLAGRRVAFTVAGVFRDYARQQGAVMMDRERYVELTGDRTATNGAMWLEPKVSISALREAFAREIAGGDKLEVVLPGDIKAVSLAIFDRTFAVTYALEVAAVIIGLVGLSSSFGALVLARRREFGVLRHLGMTRRQIAAMLACEGVTVSGIGLAAGCALGGAMSLVLVHVVNRQSFHWTMDLAVPWLPLGAFVVGVLVLAMATVIASGRQAMSDDAVRAVKDDW